MGIQSGPARVKTSLAIPQNVKRGVTNNFTAQHLPKRLQTHCSPTVTSAILIIAKKWEQCKSLSIYELINEMQYIHIREYYSPSKMNEVPRHATT